MQLCCHLVGSLVGTNNILLLDRWRHLGAGGLRVRELSVVCLHNAIVARCILDTNIALWDTRTASAPSILLVLLEPHYLCFLQAYKYRNIVVYHLWSVLTLASSCRTHTMLLTTSGRFLPLGGPLSPAP